MAFGPLARAAVERRKASAPEARTDGNVRFRVARAAPAGAACGVAPFGASPPSIFWSEVLGRAFLQRGGTTRMRRHRENGIALSTSPRVRGEVEERSDEDEGASPRF